MTLRINRTSHQNLSLPNFAEN